VRGVIQHQTAVFDRHHDTVPDIVETAFHDMRRHASKIGAGGDARLHAHPQHD
jgi:hypothetical protein